MLSLVFFKILLTDPLYIVLYCRELKLLFFEFESMLELEIFERNCVISLICVLVQLYCCFEFGVSQLLKPQILSERLFVESLFIKKGLKCFPCRSV